tara:strand:+ start:7614 stop:8675 length:1062 start_codon:yes stop_codon:yes gene_type:complete
MFFRFDTKKLTVAIIGITFIVIAMGGMIRIYDAGESCPDWPTCFGSWSFDISSEEQEAWWEENPDEIDSRGEHHRYTTFEIFTEWFHRVLAGVLLGPLILVNAYLIRKNEENGKRSRVAALVTVGLIIWQGAIGWLTVEMDNEHWSVAIHLASALIFQLSLIWLWLSLNRDYETTPDWINFDPILSSKWKKRIIWLEFGSFLSLFIGVFVSTTPGANFGCGVNGFDSWPLCQGELVTRIENFELQSQIIHRWIVAIVGIAMVTMAWLIWKDSNKHQTGKNLRNWIWITVGLYLFNMSIGALYITSYAPQTNSFQEWLSLVHLMIGSLTFLALGTSLLAIYSLEKNRITFEIIE